MIAKPFTSMNTTRYPRYSAIGKENSVAICGPNMQC